MNNDALFLSGVLRARAEGRPRVRQAVQLPELQRREGRRRQQELLQR